MNYRISTKSVLDWSHSLKEYQDVVEQVDPLAKGLQIASSDFVRMEVNEQRSGTLGNDPMLYGYNGVGHGGSNERDFVRKGLFKLGIPWFDMRSFYADGVPAATDTLLGLRYVISWEDLTEEKGYRNATNFAGQPLFSDLDTVYDIYYNSDALGVAMLSGGGIDAVETGLDDVFENLNETWSAISGEDAQVFHEETEISFTPCSFYEPSPMEAAKARELVAYYDAKASASESGEIIDAPEGALPDELQFASYIEYTFTARQDGPVYAYHRGGLWKSPGARSPCLPGSALITPGTR